jgi:hypothetical protein
MGNLMDPITIALSLAQFAPDIIKYFTKNETAAAVAGQVIDIAKTVTGKGTAEEALETLKLDPAAAVQFRTAVIQNETELQRLYLADVQSARDRDVKLLQAGGRNRRADVLAGMAVMLVAACLLIVVWGGLTADEFAKGTITLVCGRALGWVEQIFSFEFGTTRSSKLKDDTISKLTGQ